MKKMLFAVALIGAALSASAAEAAEQKFITLGTGGVAGVYYPAGGAICRMVNKGRKMHGVRCSVESTGGSKFNIDEIRAGELDMGIVQTDVHYEALHGLGSHSEHGPFSQLRSMFSLHAELFTLVARADAGIKSLQDLPGKRVNVGNAGSGQRNTMEALMAKLGWTMGTFSMAVELKSAEQSAALCNDEIDAMVFTVGHPNGSIKEATTMCGGVLVDVAGLAVESLIGEKEYYSAGSILGGMYRGNANDISTFGGNATFVTSSAMDADIVYNVVRAVFENFEDFKKLHPVLKSLDKKTMAQGTIFAPLHEGAVRYFKEAGLM